MPKNGNGLTVRVDGLRHTVRNLEAAGVEVEELKQAINDSTRAVVEEAHVLVPRQSGALDSSIRPNKAKGIGQVLAGKAAVPYAGPIHFGWAARGIAPNPFLYNALDHRKEDVRRAWEKNVAELTRKANVSTVSPTARAPRRPGVF